MSDYGNLIVYKDKNGNNSVEVKMYDNNVWLSQEQLVKLYNSSKSNISEHIKHIFEEGKLNENSVVRRFRTTASEEGELNESSTVRNLRTVANNGKTYNMLYYNLDMIVAIGFRVRSNVRISGGL